MLREVYIQYHISRMIGSLLDLREMLRQVFDIVQKSPHFDRISVYVLDEKRKNSSVSVTADSMSLGKSRSGSAKARPAEL